MNIMLFTLFNVKEFMREAQRDSAIVEPDLLAGRVRKAITRIAISRKRKQLAT